MDMIVKLTSSTKIDKLLFKIQGENKLEKWARRKSEVSCIKLKSNLLLKQESHDTKTR